MDIKDFAGGSVGIRDLFVELKGTPVGAVRVGNFSRRNTASRSRNDSERRSSALWPLTILASDKTYSAWGIPSSANFVSSAINFRNRPASSADVASSHAEIDIISFQCSTPSAKS